MEPVTDVVVAAVGKEAAAGTIGFFKLIAGPAAEELGLLYQDALRMRRFVKQVRRVKEAKELLRDAGIVPRTVPFRLLAPLLEGASLEEESEDLSMKWAALLANAAAPDGDSRVLNSYPMLLAHLSPSDAQVLEFLCRVSLTEPTLAPVDRVRLIFPGVQGDALADDWGIAPETIRQFIHAENCDYVSILLDNLVGLGLVEREPVLRLMGDGMVPTDGMGVRASRLGLHFFRACSPPQKVTSERP